MSAETSKAVRTALKAAGYGPRLVSVRNQSYSMGSTVHVTVKSSAVALSHIKAIALRFEHVHRDHNGDILAGGNTYMDIEYDRDVLREHEALVAQQLGAGRRIFGRFHVRDDAQDPDTLHVWTPDCDALRLSRRFSGTGALTRLLAEAGELGCLDAATLPVQAPANDSVDAITEVTRS